MPLTAEIMKAVQEVVAKGAAYDDIIVLDTKNGPLCLSLKMLRAANPPPGHFLVIDQVAADMVRATAYKAVPVMEGAEARAQMRAAAIDARGVTVQTPTTATKLDSVLAMIPRTPTIMRSSVTAPPTITVDKPILDIEDLPTAEDLK